MLGLVWISVIMFVSVVWRPAPVSPSGDYFTLCGFKALSGLPCPGCGLTHSFCAIGKGDFTTAFQFHLLGPAFFVLLLLVWARSIAVLTGRLKSVARFDRAFEKYRIVKRTAIVFVVFGAVRIIVVLMAHTGAFQNSPFGRLVYHLLGQ